MFDCTYNLLCTMEYNNWERVYVELSIIWFLKYEKPYDVTSIAGSIFVGRDAKFFMRLVTNFNIDNKCDKLTIQNLLAEDGVYYEIERDKYEDGVYDEIKK